MICVSGRYSEYLPLLLLLCRSRCCFCCCWRCWRALIDQKVRPHEEKTINLIRWLFYRLSFENHLFSVNFRSPYDIDKINNPIQTHTQHRKKTFSCGKKTTPLVTWLRNKSKNTDKQMYYILECLNASHRLRMKF